MLLYHERNLSKKSNNNKKDRLQNDLLSHLHGTHVHGHRAVFADLQMSLFMVERLMYRLAASGSVP